METIKNQENDTVDVHCIYCGEVVGRCDQSYLNEYPNSSDVWIEQLSQQHGCRDELTWVCEHCGEEYFSCDPAYYEKYPNGSSLAIEQARERHREYCPCSEHKQYDGWAEEALPGKERIPRKARRISAIANINIEEI